MPTDWEDHYRRGEMPWDKGAPAPALLDFLLEEPMNGAVLVPGCGMGHDVRSIAPMAREVVGIDIAPSAVASASQRPAVGSERYEQADLFNLPAHFSSAFDWVWEHTCFCAIDPARRPEYVKSIAGALRKGGVLLGIFYLDPGQARRDEGPPFETTLSELDRLFLARFELLREWSPRRTYPGRERREWMRMFRLRSAS